MRTLPTLLSVIVLLMCLVQACFGQTGTTETTELVTNPLFRSAPAIEEGHVKYPVFGKDAGRLLAASRGLLIDVSHFVAYAFTPSGDQQYNIEMQSDSAAIGWFIFDESGEIVASPPISRPPAINRASLSLHQNKKIWMVLASSDVHTVADVRVGIFDAGSPGLGASHDRPFKTLKVGESNTKSVTRTSDSDFPSLFYKPETITKGYWTRIKASFSEMSPYILLLGRDEQVVTPADRQERSNSSMIVIDPQTEWSSIAIQQFNQGTDSPADTLKLTYDQTPYDPRNTIIGIAIYYLSNPLISFLIGGRFAVLVSYFFYLKTIRSKVIVYEVEQDRILINSKRTDDPLLFGPGKSPMFCASLCTVLISRSGSSHISKADILRPLVLRMTNVKAIVAFQYESSPDSWQRPVKSDLRPDEIMLPFDNLSSGDFLRLILICEQEAVSSIAATIHGKIKDGILKRRLINPKRSWPYALSAVLGTLLGACAALAKRFAESYVDVGPVASIILFVLISTAALVLFTHSLPFVLKLSVLLRRTVSRSFSR